MNSQDALHSLRIFTEEEEFYHDYYLAKKNGTLADFLDMIDIGYLNRNRIVVPELKDSLDFHYDNESWVWKEENKDIVIHKHPCFMPKWYFIHDFYEMIYVLKGNCFGELENHNLELIEGDVVLIPPQVKHCLSVFNDSIVFNVKIRKSTFNRSFSQMLSGNNLLSDFFVNTIYIGNTEDYILFRTDAETEIKSLFMKVYTEHNNREKYYERVINNLLSNIFLHLLRKFEDTIVTGKNNSIGIRKIEKILSYIQKNYRSVTLKAISEEFFFTEQYLSKYIKENAGQNFKTILQNIRLEKALQYLDNGDMQVNQISELVGYQSTEHFVRLFKKQYGVSPSVYRKNSDL